MKKTKTARIVLVLQVEDADLKKKTGVQYNALSEELDQIIGQVLALEKRVAALEHPELPMHQRTAAFP